ncbi:MAG: DNA repair protein RadC [Rhodocyclaceae bacterium]|nr:DNA repair protein RadC [Rhodocyclaceae bacterium]MBK6906722.1 DNA repair protein RadC [Rhodocyclaceae bacterium]
MSINDWPEQERPRERFLRQGAAALSDAELLAIFLRTGVRGRSAVDLARDLLTAYGGDLSKLAQASPHDLAEIPGMGPAKAVQLAATIELARRSLRVELASQDIFSSPQLVKDWLQLRIAQLPHEVFMAIWLDSGNQLIAVDEMFRGTLTQTSVHPREIVKQALAHNAAALIVAHNHPSGRPQPSSSDIELTRMLKLSLGMVDVRLLDHFIIARGQDAVSLAELGQLP